ncbi:SDR family oxidoreductase [Magnetococcales bacterium HHB-1]
MRDDLSNESSRKEATFIDPLFSVKNQVVVITGGSGQLGAAYRRCFQERGARVAILDYAIDEERATDNQMEICCDVTKKAHLERAQKKILDHWGGVHILINNAALDSPPDAPAHENGPFESYPEPSWDKVMEVNVKGVMLTCQVFGKTMAEAGNGSIINISSIYGMVSPDQSLYAYRRAEGEPFFKPMAYAASKSALFNMTRYLATYWAESGVRVNTLTLAGVFNHQDAAFLKAYEARMPMREMAKETDFNGAILFLASNASRYVTGSNLVVDGGWTAL